MPIIADPTPGHYLVIGAHRGYTPAMDPALAAVMNQIVDQTTGTGGHVVLDGYDANTIQALVDAGMIQPEY